GEPVIETYSNGNAILTQGFQQSNYIINSINNLTADAFQINIYPNPSTDFINIDFSQKPTCLYIEMFDLLGKQILKKELVNLNEYIDLTNLAASEYFLKITTKEGKIIKTCKIIKVE
ncbi:MAG TPA: T9SS type A sorting domain-containing protein, partial [Bacteroidales bacterium]|nr:T9SS type A sorting domain-containing protein [Bacteroidales bacterium]